MFCAGIKYLGPEKIGHAVDFKHFEVVCMGLHYEKCSAFIEFKRWCLWISATPAKLVMRDTSIRFAKTTG